MGGLVGRTDTGWITSTTIQQAAAIAVATINTATAIDIANKQDKIATAYLAIAQRINDHVFDNYYPCEIKRLNEICNEAKHVPQYEEQAGRFATTASIQFAKAREELSRRFSRFCCGSHMELLKDMAIAEARTLSDTVNWGYRYAEHRSEALNDVRWSRTMSMLGLGRGLNNTALAYAQAAGGVYNSLGTQASRAAGGALERLAYLGQRNEPVQLPSYQAQSQPYFGATPNFNPRAGIGPYAQSQPAAGGTLLEYGNLGQGNDIQSYSDFSVGLSANGGNYGTGTLFQDVYGAGVSGDDD